MKKKINFQSTNNLLWMLLGYSSASSKSKYKEVVNHSQQTYEQPCISCIQEMPKISMSEIQSNCSGWQYISEKLLCDQSNVSLVLKIILISLWFGQENVQQNPKIHQDTSLHILYKSYKSYLSVNMLSFSIVVIENHSKITTVDRSKHIKPCCES